MSLRLRYRYRHLPGGLIPRFQVKSHEHAGPQPERWRFGCTLEIHGCPSLIDRSPAANTIDVLVTGLPARRRDALAVIRDIFDRLHRLWPESQPQETVPLPDAPDGYLLGKANSPRNEASPSQKPKPTEPGQHHRVHRTGVRL